ncbi:efflux RND transporter periplasmic adaptor subunit [Petrocella sp. FN5]|uniref:efflux RND transporter periplasmic adaptor subunit n=1 Tax=Petrocella sp. FN5 TaxID=3032002 RepID=UPI0023D9B420|nr:biotin/lipoyl-binding protein [Petrocella sp. FN5]MDF1616759.1 HlyD family efflux transporter periplasmic adaptor subunit [Petrocella sp. FN5]
MKWKKITKVLIVFAVIASIIAIIVVQRNQTKLKKMVEETESIIPVTIMPIEITIYEEVLSYIGAVQSDGIQSLSFKSPGKIKTIHVKEGDLIEAGETLITLDTVDITYELDGARQAMEGAYAQYQLAKKGPTPQEVEQAGLALKKAKEVYDFKLNTLGEMKLLYDEGILSKKDYDQVVLDTTMAQNDYETANQAYITVMEGTDPSLLDLYYSRYQQAKIMYDQKAALIEDASLISSITGTVVSLPYEVNTLVPAGQPVIHIRKDGAVVALGITQEDYAKIELGDNVRILKNTKTMDGVVSRKSNIPDLTTHLYQLEVSLNEQDFLMGEIVECEIIVGQKEGILIPIESVIVDGETYVYIQVVHEARRKNIIIEEILDDHIMVSGLDVGDALILQNIKKIKDGTIISVVNEVKDDD